MSRDGAITFGDLIGKSTGRDCGSGPRPFRARRRMAPTAVADSLDEATAAFRAAWDGRRWIFHSPACIESRAAEQTPVACDSKRVADSLDEAKADVSGRETTMRSWVFLERPSHWDRRFRYVTPTSERPSRHCRRN
jgi:hypothetical protein